MTEMSLNSNQTLISDLCKNHYVRRLFLSAERELYPLNGEDDGDGVVDGLW